MKPGSGRTSNTAVSEMHGRKVRSTHMTANIGIDFGSSNTGIYIKDRGIVLREPTLAAVDAEGNVVAVGAASLLVRGRAPGAVTVRRPLFAGAVSDFNLAAEILDRFLKLSSPKHRKNAVVAVKSGVGTGSRELIRAALFDCGVQRVDIVDSAIAALKGSGCADGFQAGMEDGMEDGDGVIVCDIGAGLIESSYILENEVLRSEITIGGGNDADSTICHYLRSRYGIAITKFEARDAKHRMELYRSEPSTFVFRGPDVRTGMPNKAEVPYSELVKCLMPQTVAAVRNIKAVLDNLPRKGGEPMQAKRIILTGGGAMLPGFCRYVHEVTGIETVCADFPMDSVILGLGQMIDG